MNRQADRWLGWAQDPERKRRIALLERSPVFAGLSRRLLGRLTTVLFEKAYAPGEVVFEEGDPGKALFIVLEGQVAITRTRPGGVQMLVTLGPGESFGELALIDELPRSAAARVTEASRLLILYRSHFDALVEGGQRGVALVVMKNLLQILASYVRRSVPEQATSVGNPLPPGGSPASGVRSP
jgi:CRP-like cAMP-binding protein